MTAADDGKCHIQKQSLAKKIPSRRLMALTCSAAEEKIVSKKCILMLHPRRTGQYRGGIASRFSAAQAALRKEK